MDLAITIDTEADNQWEHTASLDVSNLDCLPRFQALADSYGMKPTYLCTYEVAEAPAFESLRRWQLEGRAEIGAHLHPWSNPPHAGTGPIDEEAISAYPSELSADSFRSKLVALTERIAERTGRRPTSYRAGRWGFSAAHVPDLVDLGYTVDCSVTPLVSWESSPGRSTGGPDFRRAPATPYFLDPDDVCRPGRSSLLELPVTILMPSRLLRASRRLRGAFFEHRRSLAGRIVSKALQLDPLWFRPYPHMSADRLLDVCRLAERSKLPVVEMMFHSSELLPGGSPYNRTDEAVEKVLATLERVFATVRRWGWRGRTLREVAARYERG